MGWPCRRPTACRLSTAAMSSWRSCPTMLDRAATGTGGARIVRGDAGIGKSTLLEAVVERARERSMTVHSTRGVQSEAHLPFAGLHQLLAPLLPRLDELGARPAEEPARGVRAGGSGSPPTPSGSRSPRSSCSPMQPRTGRCCIVADDAQLLDAPTIDVLTFVARRLAADPIVALFAVRGEAIADSGLDELHLAPLDDAASAALLRQHAPDLPPSTQERVLREAAGNPLALVELPASMRSIDRGRRATAGPAAADSSPGASVRVPRGGAAGRDPRAAAGGGDRPLVRAAGTAGSGRQRCRSPAVGRGDRRRRRGGAGRGRRHRARALPAPADGLGDPWGGVVRRAREGSRGARRCAGSPARQAGLASRVRGRGDRRAAVTRARAGPRDGRFSAGRLPWGSARCGARPSSRRTRRGVVRCFSGRPSWRASSASGASRRSSRAWRTPPTWARSSRLALSPSARSSRSAISRTPGVFDP